jgi:hypothetical protein
LTLDSREYILDAHTHIHTYIHTHMGRFEVVYDGNKTFWEENTPLERREEPHDPYIESRAETCGLAKCPPVIRNEKGMYACVFACVFMLCYLKTDSLHTHVYVHVP